MINQEWKIKTRAHVCSVTGQPFADGEPFFAALFEDESDEGFLRRDFSVAAWEEGRAERQPFSYWRSVYEAPRSEPEKPEIMERERTEDLLRRLIEEDASTTENTRFILALMLERRKTLRETDSRQLGPARLRIYEHVKSGEVFIIRDPMLKLDELESIQHEVADLLASRGGATAAVDPPPATGAVAAPPDLAEAPAAEPGGDAAPTAAL